MNSKLLAKNNGKILKYIANSHPVDWEIGGCSFQSTWNQHASSSVKSDNKKIYYDETIGYIEDIKKEWDSLDLEQVKSLIKQEIITQNWINEEDNGVLMQLESLCLDEDQ